MRLPFQLSRTFMGMPCYTNQPISVVGAPIDSATSYRPGTRMGPSAIREVSTMLSDGVYERFPVDITQFCGDAGDMPLISGNTQKSLCTIEQEYTHLCHNSHVVCLGGDHSITLAILRALTAKTGPVAVVHFDAHCDTWPDHFGEPYGHGTWLRDCIEESLVDPKHVYSIGVRSPADKETREYLSGKGGTTISAREAMKLDPFWMAQSIRHVVGPTLPVYLSLDIDSLDPSFAPGAGTPEIGGLSTIWLLELLDHLGDLRWCGMDVVEVAPAYDHSEITALAGATFAWQHISCVSQRFITN